MNLRPFISLFSFAFAVFLLAACDSGSTDPSSSTPNPPAPEDGNFKVFVSNNKANQRAEMAVTEDTTFGEVRSFATSELGLAGQEFRLMVAGKYPEDGERLGDHGFNAPAQPMSMPVGNIVVRVKD